MLGIGKSAHALTSEELATHIEYLIEQGLSANKIANEAGISTSRLSGWRKGKYPGDNAGVEAKLRSWLEHKEEREKVAIPESPGWIPTPTGQRIFNALGYAHIAGDIAIIYGAAGVGKTETLRAYAEVKPSVFVATMTPATVGPLGALEEIALAVGMREVSGWGPRLFRELVERLRGTEGLIVIDEAQHLSVRAIEAVRSLHDATGLGVALVGNDIVYTRMTGGNRTALFAQLFSRIGKRVRLRKPTKADVVAIAEGWGVGDNKAREVLRDIANKEGALREVVKTLRLATVATGGSAPTAEDIRAEWRDRAGGQ